MCVLSYSCLSIAAKWTLKRKIMLKVLIFAILAFACTVNAKHLSSEQVAVKKIENVRKFFEPFEHVTVKKLTSTQLNAIVKVTCAANVTLDDVLFYVQHRARQAHSYMSNPEAVISALERVSVHLFDYVLRLYHFGVLIKHLSKSSNNIARTVRKIFCEIVNHFLCFPFLESSTRLTKYLRISETEALYLYTLTWRWSLLKIFWAIVQTWWMDWWKKDTLQLMTLFI